MPGLGQRLDDTRACRRHPAAGSQGALARLIERGEVTWKGKARATRYRASSGRGKARKKAASPVSTRTQSDRANYDQAILSTLNTHSSAMAAEELRAAVGGEPNQLRAALHRLIDAKLVVRSGRARGTTYCAR